MVVSYCLGCTAEMGFGMKKGCQRRLTMSKRHRKESTNCLMQGTCSSGGTLLTVASSSVVLLVATLSRQFWIAQCGWRPERVLPRWSRVEGQEGKDREAGV